MILTETSWIIFLFITMISTALLPVFAKAGSKKMSPDIATMFFLAIVLIGKLAVAFSSENAILPTTFTQWLILSFLALLFLLSVLCFFTAIKMAPCYEVTCVLTLLPVVSIVLHFLIGHTYPGIWKMLASVSAILGICLIVIKKGKKVWLIYCFISIFATSIAQMLNDLFFKEKAGYSAAEVLIAFLMIWIALIITKKGKELKKVTIYHSIFILLSGIIYLFSSFCVTLATDIIKNDIFLPIYSVWFLITFLLSGIIWKERANNREIIGLFLLLISSLILRSSL